MNSTAKVFLALIPLLISLSACTFNPFSSDNRLSGHAASTIAGVAGGAGGAALLGGSKPLILLAGVSGGAIGYYVSTLRFDAGGLIQNGGQVYQIGQFVGIYIPTDHLFDPNTADFQEHASSILNSVAAILVRFPDNNILVSGNTSGFFHAKWEQKLSQQRAKKVADYLSTAGINSFKNKSVHTRHLSYVGYGDYFPIATHETNKSLRQNSRIQITSYPSKEDLNLDKRHVAIHNMGADRDEAIINAPKSRLSCLRKDEC